MKNVRVRLEYFRKPVIHDNVIEIVCRSERHAGGLDLVFQQETEPTDYHFNGAPEVFFEALPIKEIHYTTLQTTLILECRVKVETRWYGVSNQLAMKKA